MLTRRDFVKDGVALVTLGATVPGVFGRAVATALRDGVSATSTSGNKVVIVQLAGGNDGLNTVVPYGDGDYRSLRKNLAVPVDRIVRLDARIGLHPNLAPLKPFWDAKQLAIIEGVGYPNPNLSHFASMHIWQTASPDGKDLGGWMGRYLDDLERHDHDPFHGFNVGSSLAPELAGRASTVPAVGSPGAYQPMFGGAATDVDARKGALLKLYETYPKPAPYAALLETTLEDAFTTSAALQGAIAAYKPAVSYPQNSFGSSMQLMAEVIVSQPGFRVGHVTLGGFDTHADQLTDHERLLTTLADGVKALLKDLEAHGAAEDVLVLKWSEFGRRVQENGSGGTDHGTAAPMFAFGKKVKGGVYGEPPLLSKLDAGNLRYTVDFRSVYATVFDRWLSADPALVGGKFPSLGFL
jgi:uncharacterized protein (DUF1501 family)